MATKTQVEGGAGRRECGGGQVPPYPLHSRNRPLDRSADIRSTHGWKFDRDSGSAAPTGAMHTNHLLPIIVQTRGRQIGESIAIKIGGDHRTTVRPKIKAQTLRRLLEVSILIQPKRISLCLTVIEAFDR